MASTDNLTSWREVMCDAVRADDPDLSMRQWSILLTVYLRPGPHTVRALARDLNVPKPAISRALDALSILGFVKRVRDGNDKRIVIVQKTAEGAIYLDRFSRLVESHNVEAPLGAMYG
jgi:DNA-binding MarR family transcriptional regulator